MKFIFLLTILIAPKLQAYTNFVGYGYTKCATCHFSPFGGGPLNDYGRVVSATAISDKLFYPGASESTLEKWSGFAGPVSIPNWVRPAVDYRSISITDDSGGPNENKRSIAMSMDFNVVLKFLDDKLRYSFTISRHPNEAGEFGPSVNGDEERSQWISRENYVAYKLKKNLELLAGVFDVVYGLRVPDHIAFSKARTGLDVNDQQFGLAAAYNYGKFFGGTHIFTGNPSDSDEIKQSGFSSKVEYELTNKVAIGASLLSSSSELTGRTLYGAHIRAGFGKGNSVIAEYGQISRDVEAAGLPPSESYFFLQGMIRLRRGLFFLTTLERNPRVTGEIEATNYRLGPGLQWFPVQRLELRTELYINRNKNNMNVSNPETKNLFTQFHYSF